MDSIWDTWTDSTDGDDGDVSADHYTLYESDAVLLNNTGITHYRLSLSWSRCLVFFLLQFLWLFLYVTLYREMLK